MVGCVKPKPKLRKHNCLSMEYWSRENRKLNAKQIESHIWRVYSNRKHFHLGSSNWKCRQTNILFARKSLSTSIFNSHISYDELRRPDLRHRLWKYCLFMYAWMLYLFWKLNFSISIYAMQLLKKLCRYKEIVPNWIEWKTNFTAKIKIVRLSD